MLAQDLAASLNENLYSFEKKVVTFSPNETPNSNRNFRKVVTS